MIAMCRWIVNKVCSARCPRKTSVLYQSKWYDVYLFLCPASTFRPFITPKDIAYWCTIYAAFSLSWCKQEVHVESLPALWVLTIHVGAVRYLCCRCVWCCVVLRRGYSISGSCTQHNLGEQYWQYWHRGSFPTTCCFPDGLAKITISNGPCKESTRWSEH